MILLLVRVPEMVKLYIVSINAQGCVRVYIGGFHIGGVLLYLKILVCITDYSLVKAILMRSTPWVI